MAVYIEGSRQVFVSSYFIKLDWTSEILCLCSHDTVFEVLLPRFLILSLLTRMVTPLTWMVRESLPFCWRRWIVSEQNKINEQIVSNKTDVKLFPSLTFRFIFQHPVSHVPLVVKFLPLSSFISWR